MKPAFSVIFLTTLIGAAQGLFLALFTAQSYALFNLLPEQSSRSFYAVGTLLVLALSALGLFSSFFHLGRPERAWRSAAMWRTSWLSREVIVLPAFMGVVALYGLAHFSGWNPTVMTLADGIVIDASVVLGVLGTVLAFTLFVTTGMVYACLRFMQEWHTPLTVINYILLGGACVGVVWAVVMVRWRSAEARIEDQAKAKPVPVVVLAGFAAVGAAISLPEGLYVVLFVLMEAFFVAVLLICLADVVALRRAGRQAAQS